MQKLALSRDEKLRQMAVEQEKTPDSSTAVPELLSWNNLVYTMPITNSVTTARNMKPYPAHSRTASLGQTITLRVQTGTQFVNWKNSYLRFKVTLNVPANYHAAAQTIRYNFGWGGITNLFDSLKVLSRTGTELMRIDHVNQYIVRRLRLQKSDAEYTRLAGACMIPNVGASFMVPGTGGVAENHDLFVGWDLQKMAAGVLSGSVQYTDTQAGFGGAQKAVAWDSYFEIPMEVFGGLFDSDQLCPAQIASGMVIELRLIDNFTEAVTRLPEATTNVVVDYSGVGGTNSTIDPDGNSFLGNYAGQRRYTFLEAINEPGTVGLYNSVMYSDADDTKLIGTAIGTVFNTVGVTLEDIELSCDTHMLIDAAVRELNKTSARNGLEYVYTVPFIQSEALVGSLETTINKAVSRAMHVYAFPVPLLGKTDCRVDYFNSQCFKVGIEDGKGTADGNSGAHIQRMIELKEYQWRLGSQYFPHQKAEPASFLSRCKMLIPTGENKADGYTSHVSGQEAVASFERSTLLKYSGAPVNNSRSVSLSSKYATAEIKADRNPAAASAINQRLHNEELDTKLVNPYVFLVMEHVQIARAFMNNITIAV